MAMLSRKEAQKLGLLKGVDAGPVGNGRMNKTEAAYARHLEGLQCAGEIRWHRFEGIKLRLADNTQYTPDFAVMASDGVLELHEVKGFWRDDARVKIKVAAAQYPFRFIAIQKIKGSWKYEHFTKEADND